MYDRSSPLMSLTDTMPGIVNRPCVFPPTSTVTVPLHMSFRVPGKLSLVGWPCTLPSSVLDLILMASNSGFGTKMAGSPMVILWPNDDMSITLSQRMAPTEVMPTLDQNPPRVATLSEEDSNPWDCMSPKLSFTIPVSSHHRPWMHHSQVGNTGQ
jgi:hypothetical protein